MIYKNLHKRDPASLEFQVQTEKNLGQTCHTVLYALSSIFDNLEVNASDIQDKMTNAKEIYGYKNTYICQRCGMEDHCVIAR